MQAFLKFCTSQAHMDPIKTRIFRRGLRSSFHTIFLTDALLVYVFFYPRKKPKDTICPLEEYMYINGLHISIAGQITPHWDHKALIVLERWCSAPRVLFLSTPSHKSCENLFQAHPPPVPDALGFASSLYLTWTTYFFRTRGLVYLNTLVYCPLTIG